MCEGISDAERNMGKERRDCLCIYAFDLFSKNLFGTYYLLGTVLGR